MITTPWRQKLDDPNSTTTKIEWYQLEDDKNWLISAPRRQKLVDINSKTTKIYWYLNYNTNFDISANIKLSHRWQKLVDVASTNDKTLDAVTIPTGAADGVGVTAEFWLNEEKSNEFLKSEYIVMLLTLCGVSGRKLFEDDRRVVNNPGSWSSRKWQMFWCYSSFIF